MTFSTVIFCSALCCVVTGELIYKQNFTDNHQSMYVFDKVPQLFNSHSLHFFAPFDWSVLIC